MKKRTKTYRRRFIVSLLSVACIMLTISMMYGPGGNIEDPDAVPVIKQADDTGDSDTGDKPVVCVDPGHGGFDSGSTSITGTAEKDINLNVALELGRLLENNGFRVIYTRTSDEVKGSTQKQDLQIRCDLSNKENADIFVSIHCNFDKASHDTKGVETWCRLPGEKGEKLAFSLQKRLAEVGYTKDRSLRYESDGELFVIKNTKAVAALVELGFLSNSADSGFLQSAEGAQKCAEALAQGIRDYFSSAPF